MQWLLIVSMIGGVLMIAGFGFAAGMAWALTLQDDTDATTAIIPGSARRRGRRRTMGIKLSEYQRPGKPVKTSGHLRAEERRRQDCRKHGCRLKCEEYLGMQCCHLQGRRVPRVKRSIY
jgi:hypothetical protein